MDVVFNALDPSRRGYVTKKQVQDLDETLNYSKLCMAHIDAAVIQVCGASTGDVVKKEFFSAVLQELQRRRELESRVRWDFMALDKTGNGLISVQDTLMLFKMTHGDQFSIHAWNSFLDSRNDPTADVYFDEVRLRLCNKPEEGPSNEAEIDNEVQRLDTKKQQNNEEKFEAIQQQVLADENMNAKQQKDYHAKTKRLARRKQHLWEKDGIEALLQDDGIDRGENIPLKPRSNITINDIIDALELKYDLLRKRLFTGMLQTHYGHLVWSSMSEEEQSDAFEQLFMEEKQLRLEGQLTERSSSLLGATVPQKLSVDMFMGQPPPDCHTAMKLQQLRVMKMKEDGKLDEQIEKILREEFEKDCTVENSSQAVVSLNDRFHQERDYYLQHLHSDKTRKVTSAEIVLPYCRLVRQHHMADTDLGYNTAAAAVGLAEREQAYRASGYDSDRQRQEILARNRLLEKKDKPLEIPDSHETKSKTSTLSELQLAVVKEMSLKHLTERQILIHMLQGKEVEYAKSAAKQINYMGRQNKLITLRNLRNNWRENSPEYMVTNRDEHWNVLQEGVALHWVGEWEQRSKKKLPESEDDVNASILADLQQIQDQEFHILLTGLCTKTEKDLAMLGKLQRSACASLVLDNIGAIILGTFTWSEEEKPIIDALEHKYEALRQLCLKHVLQIEHGLAWNRLSDSDKDKLLIKKRVVEKKLREDGKVTEVAELLKLLPKEIGTIRTLMGEDKNEYKQRLALETEKLETMVNEGQNVSKAAENFDEISATHIKSTNLLSDLLPRQQQEQDAVIGQLRSHDSSELSDQERLLPLVLLKFEKWMADREEMFDIGALSIGLFERVLAGQSSRHRSDRQRQGRLARIRAMARQHRLEVNEPYCKETDTSRPEKGDLHGWMGALLREVEKKHSAEREQFLELLQDPGMEELHAAAQTMTAEEQTNRLLELRRKRDGMDMEDKDNQEENINILEEAAAIKVVQKCETERQETNVTTAMVTAVLLAELQDEQDRETATLVKRLRNMTQEELKVNREGLIRSRRQGAALHSITVLTRYVGSANEDELLKALEEKYDSLKDKMLLEALMKQFGEAEWQRMNEKERQRKLMELKLQLKKLQAEGNDEEIARLLKLGEQNEEILLKLMGDSRAEYERKLRERLEKRNRQGAEGEDDMEKSDQQQSSDILSALEDRFSAEKAALLAQLKGMENQFLNEKERQMALLRLRREKRQAERDGRFDEIATIMGLAERQQMDLKNRMEEDRKRQEQLAKLRLEELKRRQALKAKKVKVPDLVKDGDCFALQDIVMCLLDEKHDQERHLLVCLMTKPVPANQKLHLEAQCEQERLGDRQKLHKKWKDISADKIEPRFKLLQEASFIKCMSRTQTLEQTTGGSSIDQNDLEVSLLADLQENQNQEAETYLQTMKDMNEKELIVKQSKLLEEIKFQEASNVAVVLFGPEAQGPLGEQELVSALEGKYDALREKVLLEALMKQVGEKEWQNMSEKERQRRLAELKLLEKKLRQEGNLEQAAELIGNSIRNHENLENLIGEKRAEYEKKLQERLKKRQERLAQGLSVEECDLLEEKEIEEERRGNNVLVDLQKNFELEKERLLRSLKDSNDSVAAEKQRQLLFCQLRREQRRARAEDQYEAAALAISLGKEQAKTLDDNRLKLKQLAKDRLEAQLQEKRDKKKTTTRAGSTPEAPSDPGDVHGWVDAILQAADLKHAKERQLLMDLLLDPTLSERLNATRDQSETEKEQKVQALRLLRTSWRERDDISNPDQQLSILKEAVCHRLLKMEKQLQSDGEPSSEMDLQVALLAELQEIQIEETKNLEHGAEQKSVQTLQNLFSSQKLAADSPWYDNVAQVVLAEDVQDSSNPEAAVVKALQEKYDSLRDKLLMEALVKQCGEAQWNRLSEQERQSRLVKMKLEERRLREMGNMDDAAKLLGELNVRNAELEKKLGDSFEEQNRKVAERLRRRKELQAEREAKGLSVDDAVLESLLVQEEEQQEADSKDRKNILEHLDHHYEAEKAALLKQLRDHDSQAEQEKQRQLELLRLRRQKKQLDHEDKFESAAILLNLAEQHQKIRRTHLTREQDRQRELAMERLEHLRNKKNLSRKENEQAAIKKQLTSEASEMQAKDAEDAMKGATDGNGLQDSILHYIEKRQSAERDILAQLVETAEDESSWSKTTGVAKNLGNEEIKLQLEKLRQERTKWYRKSKQLALQLSEKGEQLSQTDKDKHLEQVAESRTEQFHMMVQALVLKSTAEQNILKVISGHKSDAEVEKEVIVNLMSDLQQKQEAEMRAAEKVIVNQEQSVLERIKETQQMSLTEGWFDNLASMLFSMSSASGPEAGVREEDGLELMMLEDEMDKEFLQEKRELEEKLQAEVDGGAEVDVSSALKQLSKQQEARKEAMCSSFQSKQQQAVEREEAKQRLLEDQEYGRDAETNILKLAEKQTSFVPDRDGQEEEPDDGEDESQQTLLQQKLAERRGKRQKNKAVPGPKSSTRTPSASSSSTAASARFRDELPPDMALSRERTVIDVTLTDDQKNELYMHLMKQQSALNQKLESEHKRHEEALKRRIEEMKERRSTEASDLLRMAERQKTTLVKHRTEEQNRQIAATKERVARMRYEKTLTMKERGSEATRKFDEFLNSKDYEGMSQDEKMQAVARKMEEKFKNDEGGTSGAGGGGKKLSEADKLKLLKERRERRKKKKRETADGGSDD